MTLPNCLKNPKPVGTVYENIWSIRSDRDGVTVDPPPPPRFSTLHSPRQMNEVFSGIYFLHTSSNVVCS